MAQRSNAIKILLVEDNAADARLLTNILEQGEYLTEVVIASDGDQALQLLRAGANPNGSKNLPDIILLDLNLPGTDGRGVLRAIKQHPVLKVIPVIVLATSRAAQDVADTYVEHANCFVFKPVDLDQFVKVIRRIEDFWLSMVILPTPPV